MSIPAFPNPRSSRRFGLAVLLAVLFLVPSLRADEPYARSRDYDLQHSRIALRFDLDQRKVIGDVTHTLAILRDSTSKIVFDSAGLTIESVTVNKSPAKFEVKDDKLIVLLSTPAHSGEKFDVAIRYQAHQGPLFHPARQGLPGPAQTDLDAGRVRGYPLLSANVRLSK
jgi:hypothetical protein